MLSTLLLLDDHTKRADAAVFEKICRTVYRAETEAAMRNFIPSAAGLILHVPYGKLDGWLCTLSDIRQIPVFWLNSEERMPKEIAWGHGLDGLLFPTMNAMEMKTAMLWGVRCHHERLRWLEEKEQLLQRLDERKWIDQAKAILCEVRGLNESDAYDFLRKQAMKDRKRIGEIAASIVKVYQLIHG